MDVIEIWVNCPTQDAAELIGNAVLEARLAASWNIYPPIRSRYHWKGNLEFASEIPLVLKTRCELFGAVEALVAQLHPYETPSILGVPIGLVNSRYGTWILDETSASGKRQSFDQTDEN
jgi:periplasmic divalent cation tolerance protein